MTKHEFLRQLRSALENDLNGSIIEENVRYYDEYISEELRSGKSEQEVFEMLGDPWVIAQTIIDRAQNHTQDTYGDNTAYGFNENRQNYTEDDYDTYPGRQSGLHVFGFDTWWKKLLLVIGIVFVIVLIVSIISGLIALIAPFIIPILIIMFVIQILGNRRR